MKQILFGGGIVQGVCDGRQVTVNLKDYSMQPVELFLQDNKFNDNIISLVKLSDGTSIRFMGDARELTTITLRDEGYKL
ncbi:hypothetical protein [Aeromonas phage 65.2]|uniref:Uncharacterized protein n=1 Tax=Aeromonas phage 65.2 TaxID=1932896 RepID=A0A219YC33_9CAUD|nr:hypothetical protein [Aeromonas phage 65.2]